MREIKDKSGLFSWQTKDNIALIRLGPPVVDYSADLEAKEALFSYLSKVEQLSEISALLLLHSKEALSDQKYQHFIREIAGRGKTDQNLEIDLLRGENAVCQYILKAATFKKILISCLQGRIASHFFGAHLASDVRVVSDDFVVEMSHVILGTPPAGALGFFLPRYVGEGRAKEILLSEESLSATRLLELGLVQAIIPAQDFEINCVRSVRRFLNISPAAVPFAKEISRQLAQELRRYLEAELTAFTGALNIRV